MAELEIRRLGDDDRDAVLDVATRSLGWSGDSRDREFFAWKHEQNPFGRSPMWGAFAGERLAGFRVFLRWRFVRGGRELSMVRAVDTATDPEYQGQGIFKRLTLLAVDEMTAEGVDAVYNTPNEQSRPGYLKMGWSVVGRPTLHVMPRSPMSLVRMARARAAAEKWSEPVTVGEPASLLGPAAVFGSAGVRRASVDGFEAWRYGFEPLHYRAVSVKGGEAVFRVRRRGAAREVAVVEWRSSRRDPAGLHRLVRACGDYAVLVNPPPWAGLVPLRGQGPIVTWRPLASAAVPTLDDLSVSLGDLELF